jgi:hypothetical protein
MTSFMFKLTRQEQRVVAVVILLLLTGLAVKTYRVSRVTELPPRSADAENHAAN